MKALVKRADYKKVTIVAILLAVLGLNIAVIPVQSFLVPTTYMDEGAYMTGLLEPTASQKNWMDKNVPAVTGVKMNVHALERLNQQRALNGLPSLSASDVGAVGKGGELVYSGSSEPLGGDMLLSMVDNSKTAYFPPIRSQGSLGSCVAWATTYYTFTYETNYARGRTASDGNNNMIFSPKWTYNMINFGANSGSYFSDAFYLLTKHGAATWAEFPYDSNYLQWNLNAATWRNALNYRATGWSQIYNSDTTTLITQLKTQLANGHVMVIGTYVSSWVSTTIKNDLATAEDDAFVNQRIATYMTNTRAGGHGMTLVGYNDNIWCDLNGDGNVDAGEKGAFKIANSWGTGDWNAGFRWVAYDSLYATSQVHSYGTWPTTDRDSRGIFRGGDIYTLTVSASYTPKVVAEFTINHLKRSQLYMTLGTGSVTTTTPSSTWTGEAIYGSGGSWAFDGTSVARDGTFFFDFTNMVTPTAGATRWFVGMRDSTTGDVATIKAFKLYEVTAGGDVLVASSAGVPQTADGSLSYVWVDYQYNSLNSAPTASVQATPMNGDAPLAVAFDGSSSSDPDGTIVSFKWNFGDGSSGTGATVSHTYTSPGSYTATLTVTDNDGATNSKGVTITVTAVVPNKAPNAVPLANVTSGSLPLWVAFDGSGSTDSDGTITAYNWNFGDGTYGSGKFTSHTYTNPGNYVATLTVTDDDGATASSGISITVMATPNLPPNALAKSNTTSGSAPLYIAFDGSSSTDTDGTIANYQWNFGDGATGTGANVVHCYEMAGTYKAVLTVTDDDGAKSTSEISIAVAEKAPVVINPPSNLRGRLSAKTVVLTWRDNSNNENVFIIERAVKINGIISAFEVVGTVGPNVTTYRYSPAMPGSYIYRVCAVNTILGMSSAYSNQVTVQVK